MPASGNDRASAVAVALLAALDARDRSDRTRAAAPLVAAEDAVAIDTTTLPVDGVIDAIMELVRRRLAAE